MPSPTQSSAKDSNADYPLVIRQVINWGFTKWSQRRIRRLDSMNVADVQHKSLLKLVQMGASTQFGLDHGFGNIKSLADFRRQTPLRNYDDYWKDYLQNSIQDTTNLLWPEPTTYFALSSGTTAGTTKFLPINRRLLKSNRLAGMTTLAFHLAAHPRSPMFTGKFFMLGGSTEMRRLSQVLNSSGSVSPRSLVSGKFANSQAKSVVSSDVWSGDLSGIVARETPKWLRSFAFPPPEIALMSDWEKKLTELAERSVRLPITMISGVPSWLLVLFDRLKQLTGKSCIADIWPTLQLVIHGGTSFAPYREVFREVLGDDRIKTLETYPASEAFVATEDPRSGLLRLVPDHEIFFEFVPFEELEKVNPARHAIDEVELNVNYAIVLTTCAGLWSYVIGDTVMFVSRDPLQLRFTGRTKYFLSAFGEHLICEEVDRAIVAAATLVGASVREYHVGPEFPTGTNQVGRHQFLVEFASDMQEINRFATELDGELCRINEDYAAHRSGDLTMRSPQINVVAIGGFAQWMKSKGKLGGQHKVPRLDNSGSLTKELGDWFLQRNLLKN